MRPLRHCDGCQQVDDHPRHVIALPPGGGSPRPAEVYAAVLRGRSDDESAELARALGDTETLIYHLDCHEGCQICSSQLEMANNAHGDELIRVLAPEDGG